MKRFYIKDFVNIRYRVSLDFEKLIPRENEVKKSSNLPRRIIATIMFAVMLFCLIKLWWLAFVFSLMLAVFALREEWLQSKMDVTFSRKFIGTTMLALLIHVRASMVETLAFCML